MATGETYREGALPIGLWMTQAVHKGAEVTSELALS
jgi:hypothetical protein